MADAKTDLTVVIHAVNEATGAIKDVGQDFKKLFGDATKDAKTFAAVMDEVSNGLRDQLTGALDPKKVEQVMRGFNETAAKGIKQFTVESEKAEGVFGRIREGIEGVHSSLRTLMGVGGLLALKNEIKELLEFPIKLAEGAAKSQETAAGMYRLGAAAGFTRDAIKEAAGAIEEMGTTSENASRSLSKLFIAGVSPEQSKLLAETAKSMASALGKPFEEVFGAVMHSVERGTTRYLQVQYGLAVNAQLEILKRSREIGREIYEDEKRSIVAEAIITKGRAQFPASTSDIKSVTELQDELKTSTSKLADAIGDRLVPAYRDLLHSMKEFSDLTRTEGVGILDWLSDLNEKAKAAVQLNPLVLLFRLGLAGARAVKGAFTAPKVGPDKFAQADASVGLNVGVGGDYADATGGNAGAPAAVLQQAERAEQRLKLTQANEKRLLDVKLERLRTEETLTKAHNDVLDKQDQYLYDNALISLDQFFSRKRQRILDNQAAELKTAQQELANASAAYERLQGRAPLLIGNQLVAPGRPGASKDGAKPGSPEAIAALGAEAAAREKLGRITIATEQQLTNNYTEQAKAIVDVSKAARDMNVQRRTAEDELDLSAALEVVDNKYKDLALTLKQVSEADQILARESEKARVRYELSNKILKQQLDLQMSILGAERARLDLERSRGTVTTAEYQNRYNDALEREIQMKRDRLAILHEDIDSGALQENALRQAQDASLALETELSRLQSQYQLFSKQIREGFTNNLANAYESLFSKTKRLKDALMDLGKATAQQLLNIASRNLAEQTVKILISPSGIFEGLGKLLGDRGSPANPTWIAFSPQAMAVLNGDAAAGAAAGGGGLFGWLGSLFGPSNTGATGATFADELAGGVIPMAEGGELVGPSHAGGGINVNAEGGEYVVNRRATSAWRPLLSAINAAGMGSLSLMPSRHFADGGPVPTPGSGGDGGDTININIHDGIASADGNNAKAGNFARHLSGVVQAEIIKQKRPGGVLAPA